MSNSILSDTVSAYTGNDDRQNVVWIILEIFFYIYLFVGAFAHLVIYVPMLAPALLAATSFVACIKSIAKLKWLAPAVLGILIMVMIDYFGYQNLSDDPIKYYLFWAMEFSVFIALHQSPGFFGRAKFVLLLYLLAHFFALDPRAVDDTRMGLDAELKLALVNPNDLAYWCGFGFFISVIMFINGNIIKKIFFFITAAMTIWVLLQTVSRSALLALIILLAIYFLISGYSKTKIFAVLFYSMFIGVAVGWYAQTSLTKSIEIYQERQKHEDSAGNTYSDRTLNLDEGIRVFMEHIWIGTGKDEISAVGANKANSPHNFFVTLGVHYGILPVLCFIVLWLLIFYKSYLLLTNKNNTNASLIGEIVAFNMYIFMVANMSNISMLFPYCTLYITKLFTHKNNS